MDKPKYVYVASSWRNNIQVAVVHALRAAGIGAYDFKNPEEGTGFHWSEVGVDSSGEEFGTYIDGLHHPRAIQGFKSDFNAMKRADACVLVLPCGRSAHLEAGWMIGQGKPTFILMTPDKGTDKLTPELMYLMAGEPTSRITDSLFNLLGMLGVED